jgi:2-keto-3-deoxy-L-rhamnonate aldolase RhmA
MRAKAEHGGGGAGRDEAKRGSSLGDDTTARFPCPLRLWWFIKGAGPLMFATNQKSLRERLAKGEPLGVFWMSTGSVAAIELAAVAKPDAIVLDAQHGLWDRMSIEHAVGSGSRHAPVLVRTAENSAVAIGQALDAGADGVIVPLIEDTEEAAAAVAAARFPPHGVRSAGGVRALSRGFADYYAHANAHTVVGVMIETERAVENAAEIAGTPGIDFVFIGSGDLAISLGTFPQPDPRHAEACRRVLDTCKGKGVPCAIFTANAAAAIKRRREGYALVVVANDIDLIKGGFASAMNEFNDAARQPSEAARTDFPRVSRRRSSTR